MRPACARGVANKAAFNNNSRTLKSSDSGRGSKTQKLTDSYTGSM